MSEAITPAAVSGDTTTTVVDGDATAVAALSDGTSTKPEEMFEITVGKDNDGKPIIKKMNREEVLKQAGLGLSSHEKFEQAKKLRGDMEALAKAMKDPEKVYDVLRGLGHDVDSLTTKQLERLVAEASEDPKDKDLRLTKTELEKFRKEKAAQTKAQEEAQLQSETERFTKLVSEKIQTALTEAKLPDTKGNRAAVAQILQMLWEQKNEAGEQLFPRPLQIANDKIIGYLKKSRVDGLQSLIEGADEDSILALLPEELQDRVAKAVSKRLQAAQGKVDNTVKNEPPKETKGEKRKVQTIAEQETEIKERVRKAQIAWEKRNGKR